jgi:hypothetical protein
MNAHNALRRLALFTVLLALAGSSVAVAGCGSDSSSDKATSAQTAATGDAPKLVKTRIALHLGLAAGAAHRWIIKPYRNGGFKKGAAKRKRTIAKGVLAAAFVAHEGKKARELAKQDPSLAPLADRISALIAKYGSLGAVLAGSSGSLGQVDGASEILNDVLGAAKDEGINPEEKTPSTSELLQAK